MRSISFLKDISSSFQMIVIFILYSVFLKKSSTKFKQMRNSTEIKSFLRNSMFRNDPDPAGLVIRLINQNRCIAVGFKNVDNNGGRAYNYTLIRD